MAVKCAGISKKEDDGFFTGDGDIIIIIITILSLLLIHSLFLRSTSCVPNLIPTSVDEVGINVRKLQTTFQASFTCADVTSAQCHHQNVSRF